MPTFFHGEIFYIINCIWKMVEVIVDIKLSYLSIKVLQANFLFSQTFILIKGR